MNDAGNGFSESPLLGLSMRQPPVSIRAEQALLGALLANNKAYDRVAGFLIPEHFADPIHSRIYQAISRRIEAQQLADVVTLKAEFENSGILDETGGVVYLAQLLTAMVGVINAGDYGRAILDSWARRQLIDLGETIVNNAFGSDPELDAAAQIEATDRELAKLAESFHSRQDGSVMRLIHAVDSAVREGELTAKGDGPSSVSTGILEFDDKILRLRSGNLYIVGGRPGMGKSALARSVAVNVSVETVSPDGEIIPGHVVVYFTMEEDHAQFGAAVLAQTAGVPIGSTLNGSWTEAQMIAIGNARQRLLQAPLEIVKRKVSVQDIRRECRQIMRKHKRRIALVVVDYLQLMPDPPGQRDKRLAVGANAYGLKHIAGELECAVMALSQLSRAVEDRPDKRPTMRDLRESGEIEDAADVILFPFREEYYALQDRPKRDIGSGESDPSYASRISEWQAKVDLLRGKAELLIPKVRRGAAPAHLNLHFNAERTRFEALRASDDWGT